MKFIKYLAVLVMAISFNAFAIMSPADIGKLIDDGKLVQAESALQDVLKERDTAKIHYMLAQVYAQMRRSLDAKNELAKADQMDPKHSYTTDEKYATQAAKILGTATTAVTVSAPPQVHSIAPPKEPGPSVGTVFMWLFGILGGLLAVSLGAYALVKRKKKIEAQELLDEAIADVQNRAAGLVQKVTRMLLDEQTSANPVKAKITALELIKVKILNLYDRVKNSTIDNVEQVLELIEEWRSYDMLLETASVKDYSEKPVVKEKEPEGWDAPAPKPQRKIKPAQYQAPRQSAPAPVQQPQVIRETTVVHEHGGSTLNDVLVTSVLLDSMNHNHRNDDYDRQRREEERRDRQREQDAEDRRERQRQADADRQAREDREEESRRSTWSSPSSDSGSSSNWSDSSSSSSSDSGSSSDW